MSPTDLPPANRSKTAKPSQRIAALDLARILAMIMMIQGHTMFALASPEVLDLSQFPWNIWNFLRGVTAPVFLMVSGAVHVFANKRNENGRINGTTIYKRVRMAVILIAIGYMMVFPASKIYDLPFLASDIWQSFFAVNVLQLFGVSQIMLTLLYMATRNDRQLGICSVCVALCITFLTPFVHSIHWAGFLPLGIADYLTMEKGSLFPIFPFTAFLFYGVGVGVLLKSRPNEDRLGFIIKWGIPAGVALCAIGGGILPVFKSAFSFGIDWMRSNPGIVLVRAGIVLMELSVISFIFKKLRRFEKIFVLFGKRAIYVYVVHLIVIYGTPVFPGFEHFFKLSLSIPEAIFMACIVITITLLITYAIDQLLKYSEKAKELFKYSVTAYLIYMLLI